jgi:hypothetical protein
VEELRQVFYLSSHMRVVFAHSRTT